MNTTANHKQPTIVIIDDDIGIRESLKDLLALESWDSALAETGKEGLELIQTLKPELVLSDIQLPDMSGFQLCQSLKRDTQSRDLPVVLMTGRFTEHQDRIQGFESGADEYFNKPFEPTFLISRIKSILRGLQPQAA